MTDLRKFERNLSPLVRSLIERLEKRGYVATVVGGIVRDYLRTGEVGTDWDLELTHPTLAWDPRSWKELGKDLGDLGRVNFLAYDIIRLEGKNESFELSPPRKENFTDEDHHKNFTVEFDFRMPFSEAVLRRDFTINAMGIQLGGKMEFLDPLGGLLHLRNEELHATGSDFAKDPVRFLRAIRFSVKLGFKISPGLESTLSSMRLSGLTNSYFWKEMQKSEDPLEFYRRLLLEKENHPDLRLPTDNIIAKIPELKNSVVNPARHESWLMALEWEGINTGEWQKFFGISSEGARRISRWVELSKEFQSVLPEEFHGEFDSVRGEPKFEILFDWYFTTRQIQQKNPDLPVTEFIGKELPEWVHLFKFEAPKDVKHIDPPLRAKYQVWNLCQRL